MSTTKLVTKAEALDMLSARLREMQPSHLIQKLLGLYATIAGWNKLVRTRLGEARTQWQIEH